MNEHDGTLRPVYLCFMYDYEEYVRYGSNRSKNGIRTCYMSKNTSRYVYD